MFFLGVSSSLNCGVTPSTKTTTRVVRQRACRPLTSRRSATRGRVVAFRASATSAVAKSNGKSAIVIGAGPAGALTAAHLAALGGLLGAHGATDDLGRRAVGHGQQRVGVHWHGQVPGVGAASKVGDMSIGTLT